jgi:thiol-disulfide isomerase/thioredoxin
MTADLSSNLPSARRRLILATALLLTLLTLLPRPAPAQAAPAPKPRVYAVVFQASWCANCKELAPKAGRVLPPFIGRGVAPVPLDMSDEAARRKSLAAADRLGLRRIADGNDGTGFIVLVDARRRTRLGRITANMTEAQMADALSQALRRSSVPAPAAARG